MADSPEHILKALRDTFGPTDSRYTRAKGGYEKFAASENPDVQAMGHLFLVWCRAHPERLGSSKSPDIGSCRQCPGSPECYSGFLARDRDTFEPCRILNPQTHENWRRTIER